MKSVFIIIFSLIIPGIIQGQALLLTYEKAISLAIESNITLKQQENQLKIEKTRTLQRYANFLPSVNLAVDGTNSIGRQFDNDSKDIVTKPVKRGDIILGINYLVFGGLGQYSQEGSKLVLSANAMWGVSFSPNIETALGSVKTRGNPPTTLCGFSADYEFVDHLHANLSVDVVNFSFVISDTYTVGASNIFAPNNSTDFTMIKLGLGYAF